MMVVSGQAGRLTHTEEAMTFAVEKEGPKRWNVVDLTKRKNSKARVVDTFTTKAAADTEAAQSNLDLTNPAPAPVAVVEIVAVDPAAMDVLDRLNAAKVEAAAKKAWKQAGATGEPPATPVLDWMNATPAKVRHAKAKGGGRTPVYTEQVQSALLEAIKMARSTGVSYPRLADKLNAEQNVDTFTGPKLYALACRHGLKELPLTKS